MDLGLERAGMTCKWQVEIDDYASRVLTKHWPRVTRYQDVRTVYGFDQESWRHFNIPEPVELLCGGFPCQDISTAGKGIGIIGARSGLWSEFARLVAEVLPKFIFAENVPALRARGLALVLQDLWALGYDAEWHCIPASALGANHERDRIWIVGYPAGLFRETIIWGEPNRSIQAHVSDADGSGCPDSRWGGGPTEAEGAGPQHRTSRSDLLRGKEHAVDASINGRGSRWPGGSDSGYSWQREQSLSTAYVDGARLEESQYGNAGEQPTTIGGFANTYGEPLVGAAIARGERHAWTVEPGVVRMVHGVPNRVHRLRGLGNAVVPQLAEWIGRRIMEAANA
jgi:DNA (cytosine-5)-methyltransferase 1